MLSASITPLKDTAIIPLIYSKGQDIELETSSVEFTYKLSLQPIETMEKDYVKIRKFCGSTPHMTSLHENLFGFHNVWNTNTNKTIPVENLIGFMPDILKIIESNIDSIRNESNKDRCDMIESLSGSLNTLNIELLKLNSSIFSSITQMIPMDEILGHSYNFTSNTKLSHALDFSHWFTINFFKYAKLRFSYANFQAYITIRIPLYSHAKMSKIYPKPFSFNNLHYIFNTQSEYTIESQNGIYYFSDFGEYCFYANNKTFCKRPKSQDYCNNQYIAHSSDKFIRECFKRLQLKDTITQIGKDIYFLLFQPLTISVSCEDSKKTVTLVESSKFLDCNCRLNTSIVNYDPRFTSEYAIFFGNQTYESNNPFDWLNDASETAQIVIKIFVLILLLAIYLLIATLVLLYRLKKSYQENRHDNTYAPNEMLETLV